MNYNEGPLMQRQVEKMSAADLEEYKKVKRDIRFDGANRAPHKLEGWGQQSILSDAYARDFRPNQDIRGAWRLIYDYEDADTVSLHGIIDYHGGGQFGDCYLLAGERIDLS